MDDRQLETKRQAMGSTARRRLGGVWLASRRVGRSFVWRVRWVNERGVCRSLTIGTDRRAAAEHAAHLRAEQRRRLLRPGSLAWSEFARRDLEDFEVTRRPGTAELVERTYRLFGESLGLDKALDDLSFADVERFRRGRLAGGVSPATVNLDLRNLRGAFNRAVRRGCLEKSPLAGRFRDVALREPEPCPRMLQAEEFARLLAACPTEAWRGVCLIGYWQGLRIGEILALEWSDVELLAGVLHVRNKPGQPTKSGKNRTIPLAEVTQRWLRRKSGGTGYVIGSTSRRPGRRARVSKVSAAFSQIVRKAGLVDGQGKALYSLHDLRRTCLTRWLEDGADLRAVQTLAGHASVQTTLRHYAAVTTRSLTEVVARRDKAAVSFR